MTKEQMRKEFNIKFCISHTDDWIPELDEDGIEMKSCLWTPIEIKAFIERYMDLAKDEGKARGGKNTTSRKMYELGFKDGRLAGIKECIKDSIKQST